MFVMCVKSQKPYTTGVVNAKTQPIHVIWLTYQWMAAQMYMNQFVQVAEDAQVGAAPVHLIIFAQPALPKAMGYLNQEFASRIGSRALRQKRVEHH
jgi:hypothetical protein